MHVVIFCLLVRTDTVFIDCQDRYDNAFFLVPALFTLAPVLEHVPGFVHGACVCACAVCLYVYVTHCRLRTLHTPLGASTLAPRQVRLFNVSSRFAPRVLYWVGTSCLLYTSDAADE